MAPSMQTQAACLLLLLLASLTSGSVLPQQVRAHQTWAQQGSQDWRARCWETPLPLAEFRAGKGGMGSCSKCRDGGPEWQGLGALNQFQLLLGSLLCEVLF